MDITLMRLQYEILNVPVSQLADMSGISESMIQDEINRAGWQPLWPNEPSIANLESIHAYLGTSSTPSLPAPSSNQDQVEDDFFMTSSAEIIERSKRRLQLYVLAKETLLAQKYLDLENGIIDAARVLATSRAMENGGELKPSDVKELSLVFKNMGASAVFGSSASFSFAQDESGLPTLIYKDLSKKL